MRRPATWIRLGLLLVLLGSGALVVRFVGLPDLATVRRTVGELGSWGPLAFVLAYVVCSLLVLPKAVLSIVAGLLWGLLPGVGLVLLGAMLGAGSAFWVGRWLGRDALSRLAGRHLARLDRLVDQHGVVAILIVRLIPVIPFTVINYVAGLTVIRFGPYLLGTAIGIAPGTIAYVALGAYGTEPGTWEFAAAVAGFVLLTIVGVLVARGHRVANPELPEPDPTGTANH